ncbi:MAG: PDZ domain (also known as DHR or GLGF) [Nitrospira sp.]|nr:MAG: PDZ domain (also known as DHR or GLGF) [Nitrospira sp.]
MRCRLLIPVGKLQHTTAGLIFGLGFALFATAGLADDMPDERNHLAQLLRMVSSDRMLADIRRLSGPEFNGRQTGTSDDLSSAEFVQHRFMDLNRQRATASGSPTEAEGLPNREVIQSAPVRVTTIGHDPLLQVSLVADHQPASIGTDYLPVLDSPSADLQAPLVFVGYGISDPTGGFDEYAGLDVRNKVVLFLRGKPERYGKQVSHADKERTARERGAIGYLTAVGPILNAYETRRGVTGRPSAFYGLPAPEQVIPGAWISTTLASAILNTPGPDGADRLRTFQQQLNETMTPRSLATGLSVKMLWRSLQQDGTLHNGILIISGRDPARRDEAIVIGAHRDHFGKQGGLLFAGADDNASGTAVLLEVARVLASVPNGLKRSIVLVSFSGEEQGLLGSTLYVTQPAVPLRSTLAMVNVDHAAVGNGRLTVGVTGLEKTVAQQAGQQAGLADIIDLFGFFPGGDHVPFKEAGVPTVTVVSGGIHPHFHQPTDTADTVDPDILSAAARYVLALAWQLADAP